MATHDLAEATCRVEQRLQSASTDYTCLLANSIVFDSARDLVQ